MLTSGFKESLKISFRAMLLKRKKKQKKVVEKKIEWIEKPIDVKVQQGKAEEVIFTAKFSEKEKKGKWYLRNNVGHSEFK